MDQPSSDDGGGRCAGIASWPAFKLPAVQAASCRLLSVTVCWVLLPYRVHLGRCTEIDPIGLHADAPPRPCWHGGRVGCPASRCITRVGWGSRLRHFVGQCLPALTLAAGHCDPPCVVLARRGTVILMCRSGRCGFRAYGEDGRDVFNGDPRGAKLACAGFRQHPRVLKKIGNVIQPRTGKVI